MNLDFVDPLVGTEWDDLVGSHPDATIFHTSAWARVLARAYGHQPFYLRLTDQAGLAALLPIMEVRSRVTGCRGVCLPFTDFCEPLEFRPFDLAELTESVIRHGRTRGWSYLEVRGQGQIPSSVPNQQFFLHTVELGEGFDRVVENFGGSVRRAIRRAEKMKVQARISNTWDAVAAYYSLHVRTRRRHGLPPQPLAFFKNIFEEIIRPGLGFVVSASNDAATFAAAVFFGFNRKALYKFGASDERLQSLRGNNLVMSEAIRHFSASGYETLSLGRTSLASDTLRQFKLGWGAREELVSYANYAIMRPAKGSRRHNTEGLHNVLFRHLPLTINRMAGTVLYPHLD